MDVLGSLGSLATQPLRIAVTALLRSQLLQFLTDGAQLEALGVLGSELVLQNCELRPDALQRLVPPQLAGFAVTRGFVRELRVTIPWTALFSQAVTVRLDTVECVLSGTAAPAANQTSDCSCDWQPSNGFDGFASATAAVALIYTLALMLAVACNLRNPESKDDLDLQMVAPLRAVE